MINKKLKIIIIFCVISSILMILCSALASKTVTTLSQNTVSDNRMAVIIDPGHGGIDGGATSVSGITESKINLEIALMLQDMFRLLGIKTIMIRTDDTSIYTTGNTIAEQKVSDLKERVRIVNSYENAVLISIHQNYFSDGRYSGAQVFYSNEGQGRGLAQSLQTALVKHINPGSNRKEKNSDSIYLLNKINTTGVLIECGFLSNYREDQLLQSKQYQQKLCMVIASETSTFMNT